MTAKISKKIQSYKVKTEEAITEDKKQDEIKPLELLKREEVLHGATYKIKAGQASNHAIYVTINNIEVDNTVKPFEIFANTKDSNINTWLMPLTRMISAVFRHNTDITFVIDELKSIQSPSGGWFEKGVFVSSIPAKIGMILEKHLNKKVELDENQRQFIAEKRKEFEAKHGESEGQFPPQATLCTKCNTKAVIRMDGCDCCLSCGNSKCG
jgi:hypothetical protein